MDIETRLRHDLADRAGDITAAPTDLYEQVLDGRRTQRRHRMGLVALAVALAGIVALVPVTVGSNGPSVGGPGATTAPGVEAGYVPWDVAPRGSLAGNAAYLQALLQKPWSSLPEHAGPPVETRHVVFAGEIGGEVTALVIGWQDGGWQGIWWEGAADGAAADLAAAGDAMPLDPDFVEQYTGGVLLVIGRPGDTIEISPRQDIAADGSIVPAPFVPVADATGVGTVDGAALGTARIRVTRDGQVVLDRVLHGGQETREGTADQLDLSAALGAAAGKPEEPLVRLMVQSFLDETGLGIDQVRVGVRWGGPIGNDNLAATSAVVTIGVPSGATVVLGGVGSEQTNGDTWVVIARCGQAVLPAGTDVGALLIGMRCDLTSIEDGAGLGSQVVVVPPAGAAAVQLTGSSGGVIDTRTLTGPAYVGAAPDGLAGVTALDATGGVLTEAPLLGMADLQLPD
jgi:hypothetical protein